MKPAIGNSQQNVRIWRIIAICMAVAAAFVLQANCSNLPPGVFYNLEDRWTASIPLLCFTTALFTSVTIAIVPHAHGVIRGTFVGASLFLVCMLWMLLPGSAGVLMDGVGYWASVAIPSFLFGLPLIIVGGLVGALRFAQ